MKPSVHISKHINEPRSTLIDRNKFLFNRISHFPRFQDQRVLLQWNVFNENNRVNDEHKVKLIPLAIGWKMFQMMLANDAAVNR